MKKNYILAVVLLAVCFGLTITAIVLGVLDKSDLCTYTAMAATGAAFMSCLFGLNSWKEK